MINLLPTRAKRELSLERKLRLLAVLALFTASLCLLAAAMALPTGVVLSRYEETLGTNGGLAAELEKRRGDIEKDVSEANTLIEHLSKQKEVKPYSTIIGDLDQIAGNDLTLTHFTFDDRKKLVLSGIASTRTSLSEFRSRIEEYPLFKSVELPLSSLVKDTEVPFSITITFK